jgi:hypothetical protein
LTNQSSGGKFALSNYLAADGNFKFFELEFISNFAKILSLLQQGLELRIIENG